jgi:biotin transport system permease protein
MLSLYLSQPSWLHRIPAGYKLVMLAGASVMLLPITRLDLLGATLGLGMIGHLSLGPPGRRRLLGLLKGLLPMLFFLGLAQWLAMVLSLGWQAGSWLGLEQAFVTLLRILSLVVLADLVTLSSTTQELLHALRYVLRPLRWLGVSSSALSLAMALVFRWVSLLQAEWLTIREGFLCRGCKRPRLKSAMPLMKRSQLLAQTMGDALAARLNNARK